MRSETFLFNSPSAIDVMKVLNSKGTQLCCVLQRGAHADCCHGPVFAFGCGTNSGNACYALENADPKDTSEANSSKAQALLERVEDLNSAENSTQQQTTHFNDGLSSARTYKKSG